MANKYQREIKPGVWVDIYDVIKAWNVTNPALQHLLKKACQPGGRGHKSLEQDLQDIIDSAIRAKELEAAPDAQVFTECEHIWFRDNRPANYGYYCPKCGLTARDCK